MKRAWMKCIRMLLAAVVGLALLDLFCTWYYNPASYLWDESRATDVIREPGQFTSRANEGFGWTVIDENGYNNREVPGEEAPLVLMMGSSHTEGLYVLPGQDMSAQLGEMLRQNGVDGMVYNIGTSRHNLARNIFNLNRALDRFRPSGYVTIETRTLGIGQKDVYGALDGTMGRMAASEMPLGRWLSGRPLLQTIARQFLVLSEAEEDEDGGAGGDSAEIPQEMLDLYLDAMTRLFGMVRDAADAHGVTPIIYYHPTLLMQPDGSAAPDTDERVREVFSAACDAAGVRFLDLTDRFLAAYEEEHILPHGFANTAPGVGHLNEDGNRMVAEALCEEILRKEAEK